MHHIQEQALAVKGEYFERINGGEWVKSQNLVTDEGLTIYQIFVIMAPIFI